MQVDQVAAFRRPIRMILRTIALSAAILCLLGLLLYFTYSTRLPTPTGPFLVGRTSRLWSDAARTETWKPNELQPREFMAYIWYPAQRQTGMAPAGYFPPLPNLAGQFPWYERFAIGSVKSSALTDPPLEPGVSPHPVVLFSPGAGTSSLFYATLLEELASHGYVLFGLEHTFEGRGQLLPDGRVLLPDGEKQRPGASSANGAGEMERFFRRRVDIRAGDLRFAHHQIKTMNENDPFFAGKLDPDRVGIFGHSIGGIAAGEAARTEKRFAAVANLDGLISAKPLMIERPAEHLEQPFLYLGKPLSGKSGALENFAQATTGGCYRVQLAGAAHMSFSDEPLWAPTGTANKLRLIAATRTYLHAFFDKHLAGKDTKLLEGGSEEFPEVTIDVFPVKSTQ